MTRYLLLCLYRKIGATAKKAVRHLTGTSMHISDETVRVKYIDLPEIISSWTAAHIDLRGADILDFGCGEGITALGFAVHTGANTVTGVDIMPDPALCLDRAREHLGMEKLPENLTLEQITPGHDFAEGKKFDLIYSWSAFEHVDQLIFDNVVSQLKGKLKKNGLLFIQIAPLFYSAEGSHLFHRIAEPWGHLSMQENLYYSRLCMAAQSKEEVDALWSCYQTLNRITAPELLERLQQAGLKILREQTFPGSRRPPRKLLGIYQKDVLETEQVVVLTSL